VNLELASIARSSVDLAYRETPAEPPPRRMADGCRKLAHGGIVQRRRLFSERQAKQAFKKQLAHLVKSLRAPVLIESEPEALSFCFDVSSSLEILA
jgi:hypothetical protein